MFLSTGSAACVGIHPVAALIVCPKNDMCKQQVSLESSGHAATFRVPQASASDKEIALTVLPVVADVDPAVGAKTLSLRDATRAFERCYIMSVLHSVDNNKAAAAKTLGLGLSSLYRRIKDLGIGRTRSKPARDKVE